MARLLMEAPQLSHANDTRRDVCQPANTRSHPRGKPLRLTLLAVASVATIMFAFSQEALAQPANTEIDWNLTIAFYAFMIGFGIALVLPIIIAFYRNHPNRWLILVLTIIFGATGLGWLVAMVWALSSAHRSPTGNHGGESGLNIFANDPVTIVHTNEDSESNKTDNQPPENELSSEARSPANQQRNTIAEIEKLAELKAKGAINDEEFQKLKQSVLNN